MNEKVKICDSPCVKCASYAECTAKCFNWKEWFRSVWPIVTGQKRCLVCPKCGCHFGREMVVDGFAICPVCESEVEDNATD